MDDNFTAHKSVGWLLDYLMSVCVDSNDNYSRQRARRARDLFLLSPEWCWADQHFFLPRKGCLTGRQHRLHPHGIATTFFYPTPEVTFEVSPSALKKSSTPRSGSNPPSHVLQDMLSRYLLSLADVGLSDPGLTSSVVSMAGVWSISLVIFGPDRTRSAIILFHSSCSKRAKMAHFSFEF